MPELVLTLSVAVLAVALVLLVAVAGSTSNREELRRHYFAVQYGSSVERMLAESSVDKDSLRSLRESGHGGLPRAVRELLRSEPVPLKSAAEFVKRI